MEKQKVQEKEQDESCCGPTCCTPDGSASKSSQQARDVREVVKEKYGQAVEAVMKGAKPSCCGSSAKDHPLGFTDPITRDLYAATDTASLPEEAVLASFGCGNPTALAELRAGEVVLDLGSGGGIDVLLSAMRVGPTGRAYGLDMTDEMLELANKNKAKAGATNVEFLRGTIENIPLPSNTADVIISNCVINLSGDKDAVLREAFRVLKPGGRLAVSDIVLRKPLPEAARKSMELWTGCVAGALVESQYESKLRTAGFQHIGIEPTRIYDRESTKEMADATEAFGGGGPEVDRLLDELDGAVMSAFVRATKPLQS
jgi:ubiquinone/menaquinone biosynthesis C-methylase UbiE